MSNFIKRIMDHEGLRLNKYQDTEGHWTIGYGHKILPHEVERFSSEISKGEATDLFLADIEKAIEKFRAIEQDLYLELNNTRRGVCIEMIYQMGVRGFRGFKKMITALIWGDWEEAANQMLDSRWAKQTPSRCRELAEIMRRG
jgi:lysozyme